MKNEPRIGLVTPDEYLSNINRGYAYRQQQDDLIRFLRYLLERIRSLEARILKEELPVAEEIKGCGLPVCPHRDTTKEELLEIDRECLESQKRMMKAWQEHTEMLEKVVAAKTTKPRTGCSIACCPDLDPGHDDECPNHPANKTRSVRCPECWDTGWKLSTGDPQNGFNRNAERCSKGCPSACGICSDPDCPFPNGQH